MDRKTKLPLIASTPHIKNTAKLDPVFENEAISPIVFKAGQGDVKRLKKTTESRSGSVKSGKESNITTNKKKCLPTKRKDSASTAAMGLNIRATSTNVLSCSRKNLYNCFPKPIIVDSDEETDIHSTRTKNLPEKKSIAAQPTTSLGRGKDVQRKRRLDKNFDVNKNLKENKADMKEIPTSTKNVNQTPQPSCSRPRIANKHPLSNLANISSPKEKVNEGRKTQAVIKHNKSPKVINLDNEDTIFHEDNLPVNFSSVKKNKCLEFSSLENVVGKDTIKWTPRRRGKECATINEKVNESSDSDDSKVTKALNVTEQFNNPTVKEGNMYKRKKILMSETVEQDNNLPKELFSRFADVVFKPSKNHKGCVIASSLVSGPFDFGYLEIEGHKKLTGKSPNVTYVLLEGSAKALFQGKTQNVAPGDILHIPDGSCYEFQNLQSSHARFLFVREKLSATK